MNTKYIDLISQTFDFPQEEFKLEDKNLQFHDIDLIPKDETIFDYKSNFDLPKHFYGFNFAFGGICCFKGKDFEYINGFPGIWEWSTEDTLLMNRWKKTGKLIDFSQFLPINHKSVGMLYHGNTRIVNNNTNKYSRNDNNKLFGISEIKNINWNSEELRKNVTMLHVNNFTTNIIYENETYIQTNNITNFLNPRDNRMQSIMNYRNKQ